MANLNQNEQTSEASKTEKKVKLSLEARVKDSETLQEKYQKQIDKEYILCEENTQAKRAESLRRLKLYNNQKRDQSKVGDPLLFTVFQTVLSALYEDKLGASFGAKEEGDYEKAENVTALAEHDYAVMEKDELDYDWDWDTAFFGRGFVLLNDFDRKTMTPVAEVIDPMTFLRDPRASSVNGNQKGSGSARFLGMEIGLTKSEMKAHPAYFNLDSLKKDKQIKGLMDENRQARDEAQGRTRSVTKEESLTENYEYQLLRWFTHIKGEKYLVEFANKRNLIVRFQKLDKAKWPIIDRSLFPMSHDWDGVSIPDLIEDKQRMKSVMINLGAESAKADLYPMYLFDKKRIKNPNDLDFEFNKFVPVDGGGNVADALTPIQKSVFHSQVNLILNILDLSAQKAVAAPEVAQGVPPRQDRTLGETELVVAGKDARHSLAARIFGWSEKRFWRQWYWLYKKNFKGEIDKKVIRLQGALAPVWRELTRENLITRIDPDIVIEIASVAEFKRAQDFQRFSQFTQIVIQDPNTSRRYLFRKLARINRMSKEEITLTFPPTIDDLRAEDENVAINESKLPQVNPLDDDIIHMEIHNRAKDTKAKLAHIEAHKKMMLFKKENPQMFPQAESLPEFKPISGGREQSAQGGRRQPGPERQTLDQSV